MSSDNVLVQPVRTFLEGSDLKEPHHDPFPVSRARMVELQANGLVVEHVAVARQPAIALEPAPAEPIKPKRPGRSPRAY